MEKTQFEMIYAGGFVYNTKDKKTGKQTGEKLTAVKFLDIDLKRNEMNIKTYWISGVYDLTEFKVKQKVYAIFNPPRTPEGKMQLVEVRAIPSDTSAV